MKKLLFAGILTLTVLTFIFANKSKLSNLGGRSSKQGLTQENILKDGDIIFQSSTTGQSKAIQLATNSIYSHCGIVFLNEGIPYVLEAVQPVKLTILSDWKTYGDDEKYYVKRLIDQTKLTTAVIAKMKEKGMAWMGKDYDIYFNWSDKEIYCSELVYKIYDDALGIKLGKIKVLKDYDLSHPIVKKIMKDRYGDDVPEDEPMISPGAIYESELLETVKI
jgi:Permuted papain-like amidase enzyme, YaeF/YiiX, C92 family